MKKEKWLLFKCTGINTSDKEHKETRKRAQAKEQNTPIETDSTKKKDI